VQVADGAAREAAELQVDESRGVRNGDRVAGDARELAHGDDRAYADSLRLRAAYAVRLRAASATAKAAPKSHAVAGSGAATSMI